MRNIKQEAAIWIQLMILVIVWVVILYASHTTLEINWEAVKKLPDVVVVYSAIYLAFTKWAWRWRLLQGWLVPFPDLQGTWRGELRTTWRDPATGITPGPIPVTVVIRQTFSTVSVVMYTQESMSYSTAASLTEDDDRSVKRLSYTYTNTPRVGVRDRSIVHDGAAVLRIVGDPEKKLEGEYWTNRRSTGEFTLRYESRRLAEG